MRSKEKRTRSYPSDLTDKQWEEVKPLFVGMREYTWPKRELADAVLYLVKTGCQWRHLPHDFPPYSTVHSFYRRARIRGLWDKILHHLVLKTWTDAGRAPGPTYAIIDSQSVKTVDISAKIKPHEWEKLPWRWVAEHTFSWLGNSRRLSKDYEISVDSAEAVVKNSHSHSLLRRL